jgi:4-amino-4-deoxychorismate lyase
MSLQSATWLDGTSISALPLPDRGLDFGDGLFETLLAHHGNPLFSELHMERLQRGVRALGIPHCLDEARHHLQGASDFIAKKKWQWTALRLSVLRGAGNRGYAPAPDSSPRILIVATKLDRECGQLPTAARLSLATVKLSAQPLLAGIKHLNRLEQILAAAQVQQEGTDESLVLDQADRLTSVIAGNLFLVRQGELLTPELCDCGVLGTRRRLIIEKWAPALGLKVREAKLTFEDIRESEEVFYSNSLYALRPIASVKDLSWSNHAVCRALFSQYQEELS